LERSGGRTEVLRGSWAWDEASGELSIELRSVQFGNDPRMLESRRRLTVSAERLRYELSMATTTTPAPDVLPHLSCDLTRVSSDA